jgi:hypothetical protein
MTVQAEVIEVTGVAQRARRPRCPRPGCNGWIMYYVHSPRSWSAKEVLECLGSSRVVV